MNKAEVIEQLEDLREHCKGYIKEDEEVSGVWSDDVEALNIAIDALRKEEELKNAKTYELVEELKKREGVEVKIAEPHKDMPVSVNGPAVVLIVVD